MAWRSNDHGHSPTTARVQGRVRGRRVRGEKHKFCRELRPIGSVPDPMSARKGSDPPRHSAAARPEPQAALPGGSRPQLHQTTKGRTAPEHARPSEARAESASKRDAVASPAPLLLAWRKRGNSCISQWTFHLCLSREATRAHDLRIDAATLDARHPTLRCNARAMRVGASKGGPIAEN